MRARNYIGDIKTGRAKSPSLHEYSGTSDPVIATEDSKCGPWRFRKNAPVRASWRRLRAGD